MSNSSNPFTDHPKIVGMGYWRHFGYAWTVVVRLVYSACVCSIHAFFPFLFTHTTSRTIKKLYDEFQDQNKST